MGYFCTMKPYLLVGARDGKAEQRMVGISEYIVDMRTKELREQITVTSVITHNTSVGVHGMTRRNSQ